MSTELGIQHSTECSLPCSFSASSRKHTEIQWFKLGDNKEYPMSCQIQPNCDSASHWSWQWVWASFELSVLTVRSEKSEASSTQPVEVVTETY